MFFAETAETATAHCMMRLVGCTEQAENITVQCPVSMLIELTIKIVIHPADRD